MRLHGLTLALVVGLAGGWTALAAKLPKDAVIRECQNKRPAVTMPHQLHVTKKVAACKSCHHTGNTQQSCSATVECHAGKANSKRSGCAEASATKNAFHIQCVGCHKKQGKGPTTCAQCHK